MDLIKRTWAEIDTAALLHNLNIIKKTAANKKIMAVIKADAYCHSVKITGKALWENGVDSFAVSNVEEAIELREIGVKGLILILGYTPTDCAPILSKYDISQAVFSYEYARELSEAAQKSNVKINVHLKLDTGMGRIGFNCRELPLPEIEDAVKSSSLPNLFAEGVFTHFAVSDGLDKESIDFTKQQQALFLEAIKELSKNGINPKMRHTNNSAALFTADNDGSNYCRPGIVLYGLNATNGETTEKGLIPVMTLKSVVSMVKVIKKGETVSYGRAFTADRDMRVATVTAGYGDGYPRALSNKGEVIVNGQRAKIIGRVCMDQFLIDISHINDVRRGDEVILFGKDLTASEVACLCGTINYEIVCGISKRVPRVAVENK